VQQLDEQVGGRGGVVTWEELLWGIQCESGSRGDLIILQYDSISPLTTISSSHPPLQTKHLCQQVERSGVTPEIPQLEHRLGRGQVEPRELGVQPRPGRPEVRNPGRHAHAGAAHDDDALGLSGLDQAGDAGEVEGVQQGGAGGGGAAAGAAAADAQDSKLLEGLGLGRLRAAGFHMVVGSCYLGLCKNGPGSTRMTTTAESRSAHSTRPYEQPTLYLSSAPTCSVPSSTSPSSSRLAKSANSSSRSGAATPSTSAAA